MQTPLGSQTDRLNTALAGRYRILRHLGEGGMATVYLCEDLKHDRQVALKLLKPELAAVLGAERFVQEIKTTAALQHPHILPLFDSGAADGFLFYVMPFIDGETLRAKLDRETQLGVDDAVRIARDVADALHYAHTRGIVHRDVKPENILLHYGRPMVADFGIALAVSAAAGGRMTETGLSLGTPHYMSPEQATAEKDISGRSDVYSLGSVLYEMLTGNPPHVGASAQQIIMKIITTPAELVTVHRKSVPPHVAAAVAKSLEKLPADRFESAKAFAEALANAGFGGGATAHVGTASGIAAGRSGGRRWVRVAVGVALLALGGAAGAALLYRAPTPAQVVRFKMSMPPGQRLDPASRYDTPFALSPDGTRIAYIAFDSSAAIWSIHVRSLDQFTTTSIPGTDVTGNPFFSPDGLWIGFVNLVTRTMYKVSVAGGPVSQIVTDASSASVPSWGDDHTIIYAALGGRLARVSDGGGEPTILVDSAKLSAFAMAPVMLPGSRAALVTVCATAAGCAGLYVIDLASRKLKMLVPSASRAWYLPSGHLVYGTNQGALFAATFDPKKLEITSAAVGVLDGLNVGAGFLARATISPSGTLVYVTAATSANALIVQVDRAGREEPIIAKPGSYEQPRFSPDGRRLALRGPDAKGADQIWIHDRASANTRQLTFDGQSLRPSWSPDGSRVAFSSLRSNKWRIWSAPADGSGPGEAAADSLELVSNAAVSWTRDGKFIVWDGQILGKKGAGGDDIYASPLTGTDRKLQVAVAAPALEQTGEVSPDGKWIAYVSDDAGKNQIYIQPFLVPGGRTLVSASAAQEPAWASNNELVFVNTEADSVMLARLEFGPTVKVTRTALFDRRPYKTGSSGWRGYDVSRDGKSFVFVKPMGTSAKVEPIVVLNWMDEVKRLLTAAGIK